MAASVGVNAPESTGILRDLFWFWGPLRPPGRYDRAGLFVTPVVLALTAPQRYWVIRDAEGWRDADSVPLGNPHDAEFLERCTDVRRLVVARIRVELP